MIILGCNWRYYWSTNNTKTFSYWCIWNWSFTWISNWYNQTCRACLQRICYSHRKRKIITFHCHAAWFSCWITWSEVSHVVMVYESYFLIYFSDFLKLRSQLVAWLIPKQDIEFQLKSLFNVVFLMKEWIEFLWIHLMIPRYDYYVL